MPLVENTNKDVDILVSAHGVDQALEQLEGAAMGLDKHPGTPTYTCRYIYKKAQSDFSIVTTLFFCPFFS